MKRPRLAALLALAFALPAQAASAGPTPFTPELAAFDGSRFVRVGQSGRPTLLGFWSGDCPPCVAELPALERFAREHPEWEVWLVAVDQLEQARVHLARHQVRLPVLRAGADATRLMRAAGNRHAALPYLAAIDSTGQICGRHLGAHPPLGDIRTACEAPG